MEIEKSYFSNFLFLGGERAVSDRIILFYSRQHLRGVLIHGEEVPNHVIAEVRKGLETFKKYR